MKKRFLSYFTEPLKKRRKFRMPCAKYFIKNRISRRRKKAEPVWVYLEREMRANVDKKPYNNTVGEWLVFLRDLRYYYHLQRKAQWKNLIKLIGPEWYFHLSPKQKKVLEHLKANIHEDTLEHTTHRVQDSLNEIGLSLKFSHNMLYNAIKESAEDPGVFVWILFTNYYKKPPSQRMSTYDYNSRLMISMLYFIDIDECLMELDKLLETEIIPPPQINYKTPKKYFEPKVRLGQYLQAWQIVEEIPAKPKSQKLPILKNKLVMHSKQSYENLLDDLSFLERRKTRALNELIDGATPRVCKYKFWEPPARKEEKKRIIKKPVERKSKAESKGVDMSKIAQPTHVKRRVTPGLDCEQFTIAGVSFVRGRPYYILSGYVRLPSDFIPINQGICLMNNENITLLGSMLPMFGSERQKCISKCDCSMQWGETVMKYLKETKCKCGHYYDYSNEGTSDEVYFYRPRRSAPFWFDLAKVYQLDSLEDLIKQMIDDALLSEDSDDVPPPPKPMLDLRSVSDTNLLVATILTELKDTCLIIPHLPDACLVRQLKAYINTKLKGPIPPKQHKIFHSETERNISLLNRYSFKVIAKNVDFTREELKQFNWSHRQLIQSLYKRLLQRFITKNRLKQIDHTRLFMATLRREYYGGKSFDECFFCYFPSKLSDLYIIEPYGSDNIVRSKSKPCPLNLPSLSMQ